MSADDVSDSERDGEGESENVRKRLEQRTDRAIDGFDEGVVDLLSWILDTETRARIYVQLRQHPESTSEEVANGTGLYPSTVREALAELYEEGRVTRTKRKSDGAGNNPYEYSAIPPSELVSEMVDDVQAQLNTVFNLDNLLDSRCSDDDEPVTITVRDESDIDRDAGDDADGTNDDDPGRSDGEGDDGDDTNRPA